MGVWFPPSSLRESHGGPGNPALPLEEDGKFRNPRIMPGLLVGEDGCPTDHDIPRGRPLLPVLQVEAEQRQLHDLLHWLGVPFRNPGKGQRNPPARRPGGAGLEEGVGYTGGRPARAMAISSAGYA